jgi:hypothetical protein
MSEGHRAPSLDLKLGVLRAAEKEASASLAQLLCVRERL